MNSDSNSIESAARHCAHWEWRRPFVIRMAQSLVLVLAFCGADAEVASGAERPVLQLRQTIEMPNVKGRIDHLDADVQGQRLFIAGLDNGSLEVVDLKANKWARSIPGFKKPQGVIYDQQLNKVFVASGLDAMVRVFAGDTLSLQKSLTLDLGPNRVIYDAGRKIVYVGYGGKDAGKDYGQIGMIDAVGNRHLGDIKVVARPAEILLASGGATLFACFPHVNQVQRVENNNVAQTWATASDKPTNMALDEKTQRLFVGCHDPAVILVYDMKSGREIAAIPTVEGLDGLYYDAVNRRIYVSGGRDEEVGYVYVHQQRTADSYELVGKVPTRAGAGTSVWIPELKRLYVAAPADPRTPAAILAFEPVP
jgi:DNA-binding beta-propeller fold protein YncE